MSSQAGATAVAHTNIALVKYWGKREAALMLPAASSVSLTLDAFFTTTSVEPGLDSATDEVVLDGVALHGGALTKVVRLLDLVRQATGRTERARVISSNTVPTEAGLASSASAFAALAGAAAHAYGWDLSPRDLSRLARRGSGSASRSIFGGLVRWRAGEQGPRGDETSYAEPLPTAPGLDLGMAVVVLDPGVKKIGSREAMAHTVATSPIFSGWASQTERDAAEAADAIAVGDLERLGAITEASAMFMHATMLSARPPVRYLSPASVTVLDEVAAMRAGGLGVWPTMDAGPNVKVLCSGSDLERVVAELSAVGQRRVVAARPGPGLHVTDLSVTDLSVTGPSVTGPSVSGAQE